MLLFVLVAPAHKVSSAPNNRVSTTVTTTADEFDTSGSGTGCSLREAINLANIYLPPTVTGFGGCTASTSPGFGLYTIYVNSGVYTLTLTGASEDNDATGDLDIKSGMIISGTGSPSVIGKVGWDDRIFDVLTGTVTIKGFTIEQGNVSDYGGGIANLSKLTLSDSTLTLNKAGHGGGIYNQSYMTRTNVTLFDNYANPYGGGIENYFGNASLSNVTLNQNTADEGGGGGIYNDEGTVTLDHSLLYDNFAHSLTSCCVSGGGIKNYFGAITLDNVTLDSNPAFYNGGGIDTFAGMITMTNSTLRSNSAGTQGGGIFAGSPMSVTNTTFSGNYAAQGGGIYGLSDTSNLLNVTFKDNSATNNGVSGGSIFKQSAVFNILNTVMEFSGYSGNCNTTIGGSFNLASDSTCGFGLGDNAVVKLAPLANNGGATLTHLPYGGSPVINGGTNVNCPSTDQRGLPRPVNGTCDVGAVERQLNEASRFLFMPFIQHLFP